MKVLILGSGGREHALAWAVKRSPRVTEVVCAPGNGGMSGIARCVAVDLKSLDAMVQLETTASSRIIQISELFSGQGQNPQAMLRWSDDGGSTWSNEHWVSIGQVGQYKNRALWRRLGHARDRIYEVNVSDPINAVVISANLNALAGAN